MADHLTPKPDVATPRRRKTVLVEIPRAQFESVPVKRARYILAYLLIQVVFLADRIYEYQVGAIPELAAAAIIAFFFVCYITLYINLVSALRIMRFEWFIVFSICVIAFFPFLSLLPVGYMDRKMADLWDSTQKKQDQYRQRGPLKKKDSEAEADFESDEEKSDSHD